MKNKQKIIAIAAAVMIVIIAVVALIISENIQKNTPSKERINEKELNDMFMISGDGTKAIVFNNMIVEDNAYVLEEKLYLEYNFVKDNMNEKFYWDNNENILIYTTPTEVIKSNVGKEEYYVNKAKKTTDYKVVKTDGEKVYINIEFVKMYTHMEYEVMEKPERVCINTDYGREYMLVKVEKDTCIRAGESIKDKVVLDVAAGEELIVLNPSGGEETEWLQVVAKGGFTGYIQKKNVGKEEDRKLLPDDSSYEKPEYTSIVKDFTICMGWHMTTNEQANNTLLDVTANAKGMNVISPTWFRISDNDGNISSIADATYVQRAHQLGLEVWAMVDDQSPDSSDLEVFPYTSKRENLENQLLAAAIEYGLDGINIDFEYIEKEFAEDYIQFLREFSVKCRNNGIVLSIDNYAFASQYDYYRCQEQGQLADYVIIMGYDEHGKNSKEAGSVASLKWVKEGIENMLKLVDSKKVINAIPFYTRIWEENNGTLSSRALGMQDSWNEMNNNGAETAWVPEFGQTYAEYKKDGVTYRSWLEDSASVEAKAKLISEYQLGGIAAWRLGFETSDVWNTIVKYVN